jgi:N-glycosylase/DNA lyase
VSVPGGAELDCSRLEFEEVWRNYFDLDTDYRRFRAAVPAGDRYLTAAVRYARGIRILRQDPWETLVTFLISQRKNIPAIRRAVEELCRRWGDADGFPPPERLALLSEAELRECGLGYRTGYVLAAARMTASGALDLPALERLPDGALLDALRTVPGVGPKVAACVALFGFHRLSGFPRDVWINRVLDREYGGSFPLERYAGFQGVMQQYLFYYARTARPDS